MCSRLRVRGRSYIQTNRMSCRLFPLCAGLHCVPSVSERNLVASYWLDRRIVMFAV